nr:unnamed protein product [Digitaria exilis]
MYKLRWWRADASEVMAVTAMGVWEAVLAGGGRRFIKRKDSDAGETDRAWFFAVGVRAGFPHDPAFSTCFPAMDFILDSRLAGAAIACAWPSASLSFSMRAHNRWWPQAAGIIMANKMVMGSVGFKFPIALSLIHYAVAFVLMATLKTFSLLPVAPPSKSTPFSSIFALGAVMSLSTGLANVSLKHNR